MPQLESEACADLASRLGVVPWPVLARLSHAHVGVAPVCGSVASVGHMHVQRGVPATPLLVFAELVKLLVSDAVASAVHAGAGEDAPGGP